MRFVTRSSVSWPEYGSPFLLLRFLLIFCLLLFYFSFYFCLSCSFFISFFLFSVFFICLYDCKGRILRVIACSCRDLHVCSGLRLFVFWVFFYCLHFVYRFLRFVLYFTTFFTLPLTIFLVFSFFFVLCDFFFCILLFYLFYIYIINLSLSLFFPHFAFSVYAWPCVWKSIRNTRFTHQQKKKASVSETRRWKNRKEKKKKIGSSEHPFAKPIDHPAHGATWRSVYANVYGRICVSRPVHTGFYMRSEDVEGMASILTMVSRQVVFAVPSLSSGAGKARGRGGKVTAWGGGGGKKRREERKRMWRIRIRNRTTIRIRGNRKRRRKKMSEKKRKKKYKKKRNRRKKDEPKI